MHLYSPDKATSMPPRGRPRKSDSNGVTKPAKKQRLETVTHRSHCTAKGVVLALGVGDTGQLGLGEDILERGKPACVPDLPDNIVQVTAGGMHTACLTSDGEVYTFGCNDEGGLGRDSTEEGSEYTAAKVNLDAKVVQISAGDSHTAALTAEGQVYIWGTFRDANGPIGLTIKGQEKEPMLMPIDSQIVKIHSGTDHLAALTSTGTIFTCGTGEQGQLGRVAECFATRGGRKGLEILLNPGIVYCRKVRGKRSMFVDVWCGTYNTFGLSDSGDVYAWGLNNYGQLGFSDMVNRFMPERVPSFAGHKWLQIESGQHHTIALSEDGKVYSLGRDTYGRLGLGEDCGEKQEPTLVKSICDKCHLIAASSSVSFAISDKDVVYSWGMGTSRQLGVGDEEDIWIPTQMTGKQLDARVPLLVSAGGQHTVLLAKDIKGKS